jgi:hypothetical protein
MAFAPRLPLFSEPSRSIRRASTPRWSRASMPASAAAIVVFTWPTAACTPLPP